MKPPGEDKPINLRDAQVAIHMGEYAAMRAELVSFQGLEYQAIQFAIAAVTAIVGLIVQADIKDAVPISIHSYLQRHWILVVAPPFWLLGCLFAYAQVKVMLVAQYLQQTLRPKLISIVRNDVLDWEADRREGLFKKPAKALGEFFSLLRWVLFLWPLIPLLFNSEWRPSLGPLGEKALFWEEASFWILGGLALYCWFFLPRWVVKRVP